MAFDEHRLGLKPIGRRIWALKGQRPVAKVQHRYKWLYLYAFANPQTGQSVFYILPGVDAERQLGCHHEISQSCATISPRLKVLTANHNSTPSRSQTIKPSNNTNVVLR